jgi:hypothetical protein
MVPKMDSRRNIFGTVLQTLFGIATVSDLRTWHETVDDLQARNSDMAHSLQSQVTYVQALDRNVRVNTDAISNLSMIMKDALSQSHDN